MHQLSRAAWDEILIDGGACLGCVRRREEIDYTAKSGRKKRTTECWVEIPKCQCAPCDIYCGSEIIDECGDVYKAHEKGTASQGCIRWYLTEVCKPCD